MEPLTKNILLFIILLIKWTHNAYEIIGYDCGAPTTNITTMSLLNIEECDISQVTVNSSRQFVQLLQLNDFQTVHVIQCKVEIDRLIRKCGMFSHTMDVHNGKFSYIQEVTKDTCLRMHQFGNAQIEGVIITGIKSNETSSRPVTFAGNVDSSGTCTGGAYSDYYGSWTEVVVIETIKITLYDYDADVRINSNRVRGGGREDGGRSGITCELGDTTCIDIKDGNTFWDALPQDACKFSRYKRSQTIYSITSEETSFALATRGEEVICGHVLVRTEHPKLVIFPTEPGLGLFKAPKRVNNLDIFAYMNSKFIYIEKYISHQINQLYRNNINTVNQSYFLTPQTHVLLRQGIQISCNPLAPTMYLLGNSWYKLAPRPVDTLPPVIMKPLTKPTWKYINPGSLATSGIYTEQDLETLRDHIMFPAERPAVLNTVARGVMGRPTTLHGGSIANLLDETSIEKIAISTWEKFWNKFLIFGNLSAECIAIYLLVRVAKLVLDTIVHGYALHTVYGWSLYLVGAIWDSLTQLLLHLGRKKPMLSCDASSPETGHKTDGDAAKPTAPETSDGRSPSTSSVYPLLPS
ncbi:hypothetical protein X777_14435 [Ooceraea biroi]|uniref:Glycoprotein n=1 Tax=Ooceraea biroi TaxID=2015173 RepID=A0A026WX54_OOCBI|nr:hypothetical protein X777_14435 [Ooceraea biroi]